MTLKTIDDGREVFSRHLFEQRTVLDRFPFFCHSYRHIRRYQVKRQDATMKTAEKDAPSSTKMASQLQRRELVSLVLPWAAVALIAIVAAALLAHDDDSNNNSADMEGDEDFLWMQRQLYGDDGYVPPTDTFQYSSSNNGGGSDGSFHEDSSHHHKPVYNEDHAPLFPLTSRDYVGFVCAVLGLMVAVSRVMIWHASSDPRKMMTHPPSATTTTTYLETNRRPEVVLGEEAYLFQSTFS